jgi:PAS domain S-box-containing protein
MSTNILNIELSNQHDAAASYLAKALMIADENASQNGENEHMHQALLNNIRIGIVKHDKNGKIVLANNAALEMLELTKDQMMGTSSIHPSWNVIREDGSDFPGNAHPAIVTITTHKPVHDVVMGVFRPQKKDRIWILVNADPEFDANGQLMNVLVTFTDIST